MIFSGDQNKSSEYLCSIYYYSILDVARRNLRAAIYGLQFTHSNLRAAIQKLVENRWNPKQKQSRYHGQELEIACPSNTASPACAYNTIIDLR